MRRQVLASSLVAWAMGVVPLSAWEPCVWNSEHAWRERNGEWLAIVSTERERLVFFGPAETAGSNLLFVPTDKTKGDWGGHRFWLGPQIEWPVFWPPPADWESKPAATVTAIGDTLTVTEPHAATSWPELKRVYAWKNGKLILTTHWSGGYGDWQGIHILQVPGTATIETHAAVTSTYPQGYALLPLAGRPGVQTHFRASPCVTREGETLKIRRQGTEDKIGIPASEITVHEGPIGFRVSPASFTGDAAGTTPDGDIPTQVYAGTDSYPFLEVEQTTPRLRNPASASVELQPFGPR